MRRMVPGALALAFLAGPLAAGPVPTDANSANLGDVASVATPVNPADTADAAEAATRLPDLRCFSVQGRCVVGQTPVGQTAASKDQIHNAVVAGWDPSKRVLRSTVWKHVAVTGDWVVAAKVLPAPVHCDTYLVFIKDPAGATEELWCIDGPRLLLLWEMLDATRGRFWTRQDGSLGIVLFDGRFATGTFILNTTDEQHFTCLGGAPVKTDLAPGLEDVETALGPFDISSSPSRARTLATLRKLGILPDQETVPDDIALPPSWTQEIARAGMLRGAQPASLFLLQGFWGEIACPDGGNPEACTASAENRETVWLVRVGDESSGYERWVSQRHNFSTGQWYDPVNASIGTTASVIFEGNAPLLPAAPCRN